MSDDFQNFQRAFGRHLRDPHHTPRPAGVPARRMAVYNELLFNNLCGFVDTCFPVVRELLGPSRWRRLNRNFYRDWPLHTPWFRDIPREFVNYIQANQPRLRMPRYLPDLLHYEWVELAVDTMAAVAPEHDPAGDLTTGRPVLNPTLMNLCYAWPVHMISAVNRPRRGKTTHLLVYRDAEYVVQFVESNATTARLIALLAQGNLTGEAACRQIAVEIARPDPLAVTVFAQQMLEQWRVQGIILGVLL